MDARIFKPAKPATQSGRFRTRLWVVEHEPRGRQEADRLIESAREPDLVALHALGEKISRIRDGLSLYGGFLVEALVSRVRAQARAGQNAEGWARLAARLEELFARADGLNLEPRQTVLSAARMIAGTARRTGSIS